MNSPQEVIEALLNVFLTDDHGLYPSRTSSGHKAKGDVAVVGRFAPSFPPPGLDGWRPLDRSRR